MSLIPMNGIDMNKSGNHQHEKNGHMQQVPQRK